MLRESPPCLAARREKVIVDSPGDPNVAHSFKVCHEVENKTAAYLGFDFVSELRDFAISKKNLSVDDAMAHLNGHENFSGIDDPEETFPFMENDTVQAKDTVKNKRLADILRLMEGGITALPGLSKDENSKRQTEAVKEFTAGHKDFSQLAWLKATELGKLVMPQLHYEAAEEHDLEAANRCWVVLRSMRHAMHGEGF
ncbi:hypothetical protein KCU61_g4396, partial [Aureobasidium melanogenum]